MSNFTEALGVIDKAIELHCKATETLSGLRTVLVRREQEELYGEPATPVLSASRIRALRNLVEAARLSGGSEIVFCGKQLTTNYAEYLIWTYMH
jgi:hypothetical protein